MKRKGVYLILGCEAMLCIAFYWTAQQLPNLFTTVMAFPFEQISIGLRWLSLSGAGGNLVAVVFYWLICLLPVIILGLIARKRKLQVEDWLLVIFSAVLFAVLYLMINPGLLGNYLGDIASLTGSQAILGCILYSVLIGYGVLRIVRLFFTADIEGLQRYLCILLYGLNLIFVYLIFGACLDHLLEGISTLYAGNVGNEQGIGLSRNFLILQYLVNAVPYGLNMLIVFAALDLLGALTADRYGEGAVAAAEKLSRLCGRALQLVVVINIAFNLLQLILLNSLAVVNTTVQLPLLSIAFVLGTLLLAQYIRENKRLKDDNDMFI